MAKDSNIKWLDAIKKVLEDEKKSLHYTEIAELISEKGYRDSVGATPANTVSAYISGDIKKYKEKSQFAKVDRGEYVLKRFLNDQSEFVTETEIADDDAIERKLIIEALGVYWNRTQVSWKSTPDILGVQQIGAVPVNFSHQIGVYLLHDGRETIYVGQAVEQSIGKRLYQHTMDRLSGRWDRFSWYGFYGVSSEGEVAHAKSPLESLTLSEMADSLEGILIECIEPRQNRKRGNTFSGIEYIQVESPEIRKKRNLQVWREMGEKI